LPVVPEPMNGIAISVFLCYSKRMKTITKVCEICGIEFTKRNNGNPHRFCSRSCGGKWHMANRKIVGPSWIGNKLRVGLAPPNKGKPSPMRGKKIKKRIKFNCSQCRDPFEIVPWIVKQNISMSGKRFCSKNCHSQYMKEYESGENSPSWVGGPKTYRGRSWRNARKEAVKRDGGTCQDCGKYKGNSIPVHHIVPFRDFDSEKEANQLNNLVCLCQPCHMYREPRPKSNHTPLWLF